MGAYAWLTRFEQTPGHIAGAFAPAGRQIMSDQRALSISVKALSAAVARAVAAEKNHGAFSDTFTIDHNIIMGRILREALALNQAEAAAESISKHVAGAQVSLAAVGPAGGAASSLLASHLEPAVLATHGRIICGFIIDRQIVLTE
jgi:hypothetical protein